MEISVDYSLAAPFLWFGCQLNVKFDVLVTAVKSVGSVCGNGDGKLIQLREASDNRSKQNFERYYLYFASLINCIKNFEENSLNMQTLQIYMHY